MPSLDDLNVAMEQDVVSLQLDELSSVGSDHALHHLFDNIFGDIQPLLGVHLGERGVASQRVTFFTALIIMLSRAHKELIEPFSKN